MSNKNRSNYLLSDILFNYLQTIQPNNVLENACLYWIQAIYINMLQLKHSINNESYKRLERFQTLLELELWLFTICIKNFSRKLLVQC